jgi:hypothetical protein
MANPQDPFALNVLGVTDLVESSTNKVRPGNDESPEGPVGEKYDALKLDLPDEELIRLKNEWEARYASYEEKHKVVVAKNLESYLGKKPNGQWLSGDDTIAANLQFEAEETFLSAALAKNPEPVVYADNTEEGNAVADGVKTMLAYHSDQLVLRRKLALMVRQWSIHHLGVLKPGWDSTINDVAIENRKIENYIFDPDGYVDAYGDFVGYLGERIEVSAEQLAILFPDHKAYIELTVDGKMGTKVVYTEWYSADSTFCFITYKERVLDKHKNFYFRYPEPEIDAMTGEPLLDEMGEPVMTGPRNHFAKPKKPHIFLSVYSLQSRPHDLTGLVEQNIPNQNLIRKRTEQIDYNASAANNSFAFSEDNFNEETAKQAADARKAGRPILVPSGGPIEQAVMPLNGQDLPAQIFEQLTMSMNNLRTSWGVDGITAQPQDEDQTARGMILNQANDTSRIGGGIGQAIEQVADNAFNWLTQLYYVFYDEEHFAAIMGNAKAVEFVTLSNADLDRQLIVSVAPDSLRPRDEITQINLAQALFDKGAIGPKVLLKMLDFPNADEAAADGALYRADPLAYLQMNWPDLAAQMQQAQQEKAMMDMANQAQAAGMTAAAEAGAAPEETTEPEEGLARDPASAALSNVQLPPVE